MNLHLKCTHTSALSSVCDHQLNLLSPMRGLEWRRAMVYADHQCECTHKRKLNVPPKVNMKWQLSASILFQAK